MAIRPKFTLMCDEIRQESNGKFILIGLYTPNIAIMSLPSVIPSLTFFQYLEVDRPGVVSQRIALNCLETGKIIASSNAMLNVQVQGSQSLPLTVINAINFRNVMFDRAGAYNLTVTFESQAEPLIHQFDVILNLPNSQTMGAVMR